MHRVFADYASWRAYNRLLNTTNPTESYETIRVRDLNDSEIFCRYGTTDVNVFDDTFFGRYHLPPEDLTPISTIVDLGSNIGLTIAHYSVLYPHARIVGVEMDLENWKVCQKNVAPFVANCKVLNAAVWTRPGKIRYGGSMESAFCVDEELTVGEEVECLTISQLIEEFGSTVIDFMKMDVEGAEEALLKDSGEWLHRVRCLKVEIHEPYTVARCSELLKSYGFECTQDTSHWACVVARNLRLQR